MKKGIFFQIITITIFLIFWNSLHFGKHLHIRIFEQKKIQIYQKLSPIPIIIFSYKLDSLYSIKTKLNSFLWVDSLQIEEQTKISERLIAEYQLSQSSEVLSRYTLPNVMKIYLKGEFFHKSEKDAIWRIIKENDEAADINYDNEFWEKIQVEADNVQPSINFLNFAYLIANGVIIVFLIFFVIFMRIHFEIKRDQFWKIFQISGGKKNSRAKMFFLNSFILSIIPTGLNFGAYFAAIYFDYLQIQIDIKLFIIELGTLMFAYLLTSLFLIRRFK